MHPEGAFCLVFVKESSASKPLASTKSPTGGCRRPPDPRLSGFKQIVSLTHADLICHHQCDYYKYVDDTQLSKGAPPNQFESHLCDIQTCIEKLVC